MTTKWPAVARIVSRAIAGASRNDGVQSNADRLAAALSRRQVGGVLAAMLASVGMAGVGAAKKKKRKKKKKSGSEPVACTSPGAPDSTVCTTVNLGCGGSHRCCQCRYDTDDRLLCLSYDPGDVLLCQSSEDCAAGWVCDDYSHWCLPLCLG